MAEYLGLTNPLAALAVPCLSVPKLKCHHTFTHDLIQEKLAPSRLPSIKSGVVPRRGSTERRFSIYTRRYCPERETFLKG